MTDKTKTRSTPGKFTPDMFYVWKGLMLCMALFFLSHHLHVSDDLPVCMYVFNLRNINSFQFLYKSVLLWAGFELQFKIFSGSG